MKTLHSIKYEYVDFQPHFLYRKILHKRSWLHFKCSVAPCGGPRLDQQIGFKVMDETLITMEYCCISDLHNYQHNYSCQWKDAEIQFQMQEKKNTRTCLLLLEQSFGGTNRYIIAFIKPQIYTYTTHPFSYLTNCIRSVEHISL